jgi:CheY-like chemotaxis protein
MTDEEAVARSSELHGLKILVVEDETLVAFLIEDMLAELGCAAVWHASAVGEALSLIGERQPDAAILDVNLGTETVYPVASRLDAARIPFVFATGYGRKGLPGEWVRRPVVQKPFAAETLAAALVNALVRS